MGVLQGWLHSRRQRQVRSTGPRLLSGLDPAGRGGAEPRLALTARVPLREAAQGVPFRVSSGRTEHG